MKNGAFYIYMFFLLGACIVSSMTAKQEGGISSFFEDESVQPKSVAKQAEPIAAHHESPTAPLVAQKVEQSQDKQSVDQQLLGERVFTAWDASTRPWEYSGNEPTAIMLNFSSTDLGNVLKYFEETFHVIFITDDAIQPFAVGGKSLVGSKINFSTNRPVTRKEAWNILITLLETAGVTLQPGSMERTYRVTTLAKDSPLSYRKGPLPTYIGVDAEDIPEADMRIRYVYLVKNASLEAIKSIVQTMQSPASPDPIPLVEVYGILITDRAYNIKTMLTVLRELDQSTAPETLSIIKLERADAHKVAELYKALVKEETPGMQNRVLGPKRGDTIAYFDATVRVIPEPRSNTLIALGPAESLRKLEKFIKDYEDQIVRVPYIPTYTYPLKYTQAEAVARILESALDFKSDTEAGKTGSVRNGDKFFSNVVIVPEPATNILLITAPDDEYMHVYNLLQKIDVEQPQVALDVVMVNVSTANNKALGAQVRNMQGMLGNSVNFQTGVIDPSTGVIANYPTDANGTALNGNSRLLANLLQLITGVNQPSGTTILTLGSDPNGVWGIIRMLQTQTEAKIVNNPFIVTTNKYPATINVGETRRIPATTITNDNYTNQSWTSDDAHVQVKITPQISDTLVTLEINVENSQFTSPAGSAITAGNKNNQSMYTSVLVEDGGIIVIGGLGYEASLEGQREVPLLARIPIIGSLFFKNRQEQKSQSKLLVFVRVKIIPASHKVSDTYVHAVAQDARKYVTSQMKDYRCPVSRWFFESETKNKKPAAHLEKFMRDGQEAVAHV